MVLGLAAGAADADPARADEPPTIAPVASSPKRRVPLYDGRAPPPAPAAEILVDLPRLVLAPLYLTNEYLLRRPLSVVIPAAERTDLFTKIYDVLAFGPDHKAGIFPIGLAEFDKEGRGPFFTASAGIYAFWNDAGFKGNDLSLHAEAWPDDFVGVTLMQRIKVGADRTLQLRLCGLTRPDRVFYGIGPTTLESSESRYGIRRVGGDVAYEWRFWRSSRIETTVGMRDVRVFDGHYGDAPSLTQAAATGAFPIPYGYGLEYAAETNRIVAAVDSRVSEARRGSGLRLELDGEQASDARNAGRSEWIRYGATAAAYVDLTGTRRVVSLSLTTQFADPLGRTPVPFTELVYLGGDHAMSGFYLGRLLGRSAAVATANYTWPIGPWISGDLEFAIGNVFGAHLAGFDTGLLRFSGAFGISIGGVQKTGVMGSQDAPLEVLVGVGSETFDHGTQIDSVRFVVGVPFAF